MLSFRRRFDLVTQRHVSFGTPNPLNQSRGAT